MPDSASSNTGSTVSTPAGPNVLVFICDDLEYGSLSCHGNTVVETPNIDAFAEENVRLNRHYAGPMCSPARASLQTGRWHYRTGVLHPSIGHSLMHPDEVTIANLLGEAGYRTFHGGKWHLGDNYPLRAHDQGYEEALYMRGYGTGGWGDRPNSYMDPILHRNGRKKSFEGMVDEIVTDAAIEFIEAHSDDRFLVHVAPDGPIPPEMVITDEYVDRYREQGLPEDLARYYGLVTLLDEQFGRLRETLQREGIAEETLIIFTSDHGSNFDHPVYNAGLRGGVGDVYEGGVRVPCFIHWPGETAGDHDVEQITHAIDFLPTLASLSNQSLPEATIDGHNLTQLLRGEIDEPWPDRYIIIQQTQSDRPELHRNAAVISQQYKLVDGRELYDLKADPGEQNNIAAKYTDIVIQLREVYKKWYEDVRADRDFAPPRIVIGSPHENPTRLTRNDWLGPRRNGKSNEDIGYWETLIDRGGSYDIELGLPSIENVSHGGYGTVHCKVSDIHRTGPVTEGERNYCFPDVPLEPGPARFEAWLEIQDALPYGEAPVEYGVRYVEVTATERELNQ